MKKVLLVVVLALIGYGLFNIGSIRTESEFETKLAHYDSLIQKDKDTIALMTAMQDSIIVRDSIKIQEIAHQKAKVIKIKEYVEVEINKIDNFSEQELISYLNKRYPKDTVTNPLPVAQPVLASVSKDLAAYDGAKQEIVVKDSVITLQDKRLILKDSTIGLYVGKETRYKSIIGNQDLKITEWSKQYNNLLLDYNKMRIKNKFARIGAGVIIGGLVYMTIMK